MPTHLNTNNIEGLGFYMGSRGLPDLTGFRKGDEYKYTFMSPDRTVYLLGLVNGELTWIMKGKGKEQDKKSKSRSRSRSPSPRRSPSPKRSREQARSRSRRRTIRSTADITEVPVLPEEILADGDVQLVDGATEIVIVEPRRMAKPPRVSIPKDRRRGPQPGVGDLFEATEVYIPVDEDTNKNIEKEKKEDKEEHVEEKEESGLRKDSVKELVLQLLFGPASLPPIQDPPPRAPTRAPAGTDPTTRAPVGTEPTTRAPAGTEPTTRAPVGTDPTTGAPAGTDPTTKAPVGTDPTTRVPVGTDPTTRAPVGTDPTTGAPAGTDPTTRAPAGTDPTTRAPAGTDPTTRAPGGTDPTTRVPSRTDPTTIPSTVGTDPTTIPSTPPVGTDSTPSTAPTGTDPATKVPIGTDPTTEAPLGSDPVPPKDHTDPMDPLEDEIMKEDENDVLSGLNKNLINLLRPIILACLAKYNSGFSNKLLNSNPIIVAKGIKFNYDLVITGGTAINMHYPNLTPTTDVDIKLVVPSEQYGKDYFHESSISYADFESKKTWHINNINKIANFTRMFFAEQVTNCLTEQLKNIKENLDNAVSDVEREHREKIKSILKNSTISARVVGFTDQDKGMLLPARTEMVDINLPYFSKDNQPKIKAVLDPKFPTKQVPISTKKMIKIVFEYNYSKEKNYLEMIDLGLFFKHPESHYNPETKTSSPSGYGSSFGHLLYDFFQDPSGSVGPDVYDDNKYISEEYRGTFYKNIPFYDYYLSDGPYKGRVIKIANLHSLVQNNLIMTLISYDMKKSSPLQDMSSNIIKYKKRFIDILNAIKRDYPDLVGVIEIIRKNGLEAIVEYEKYWAGKNFECRFDKVGDRGFYFVQEDKNKPGCKNYETELKASNFTKAFDLAMTNIRYLPWTSKNFMTSIKSKLDRAIDKSGQPIDQPDDKLPLGIDPTQKLPDPIDVQIAFEKAQRLKEKKEEIKFGAKPLFKKNTFDDVKNDIIKKFNNECTEGINNALNITDASLQTGNIKGLLSKLSGTIATPLIYYTDPNDPGTRTKTTFAEIFNLNNAQLSDISEPLVVGLSNNSITTQELIKLAQDTCSKFNSYIGNIRPTIGSFSS